MFYFLFLILDQLLKTFSRKNNFASINRGLAFGLFSEVDRFVFCLAVLVILFILRFSPFYKNHLKSKLEINLIFFGGLSNLIDRVFAGGTVDYFHLPLIPSFNLADLAVTLGSLCLLGKYLADKEDVKKLKNGEFKK